jgi:hypothetical protein
VKLAFDSDDESEEEQRVVRTQKDKRQDVFDGIIKNLKNHLKISDFTQIITDFEALADELKVNGDILFGQANGVLPLLMVRTFAHIDKAMNEVTPEQKKKMNSNNSKALTKLKQKFKKYLQTTGPDSNNYETQLNKFKENPVWSADEKKKEAKKTEKKPKKVEEAKKEEESEYDDEEDEDEESEDEDGEKKPKPKQKP